MELDAVAEELYGVRPDEFTAARNQRAAAARKDGDRKLADQIKALRRPTLSAWASNLLVREQPEVVEPLIRLGEGLRQAHRNLDGEQLRALSRQQHALIAAMSRQARQLAADAGQQVSEEVRQEVEQTLRAVLADPEAAQQWAKGRLTKPLDPTTGFAAAGGRRLRLVTPPAPQPERRDQDKKTGRPEAEQRRRRQVEEVRQEAEAAERELRESQERAARDHSAAQDAKERAADLHQRISELTEQRKDLAAQAREAEAEERRVRDRQRDSDRAARQAQRRADAA
ncbi:hypothetical protein FE633_39340, partial [Streptomyces montanus]